MTSTDELKHVADDVILRRLEDLVRQSRRVEAVLIAHVAEVDARRIYARDAASMFAYCTQVLHLSEHEAYARITVARASRRHPVLLAMLADGRLHVSGVAKLVPHLTDANREEILTRATYKTKREIEELVAEIAPKPDVPTAVRKLPRRGESSVASERSPDRYAAPLHAPALLPTPATPATELGPDRVARDAPIPSRPTEPAALTPLSPARYKVQFTASAALRDKLERLQALTGVDLASAIETAVTERLARLESKRFGLTSAPRKRLDETNTRPSSRYLPAPVRRLVRRRDGNRCTFVNRNGTRCTERRRLEFHHRRPYGRGGDHSPANVWLVCRAHNAYLAELDYGQKQMEQYRRRPDRVSEDASEYVADLPFNSRPSVSASQ
jgi:hypothetical protein